MSPSRDNLCVPRHTLQEDTYHLYTVPIWHLLLQDSIYPSSHLTLPITTHANKAIPELLSPNQSQHFGEMKSCFQQNAEIFLYSVEINKLFLLTFNLYYTDDDLSLQSVTFENKQNVLKHVLARCFVGFLLLL